MSALKDILNWSKTSPQWQRDALRRLLQQGKLSDADFIDLTKLCKSAHGLTTAEDIVPAAIPLTEEHLPADVQDDSRVVLASVQNAQNVNIISETVEKQHWSSDHFLGLQTTTSENRCQVKQFNWINCHLAAGHPYTAERGAAVKTDSKTLNRHYNRGKTKLSRRNFSQSGSFEATVL
jgi:hypothetical protein